MSAHRTAGRPHVGFASLLGANLFRAFLVASVFACGVLTGLLVIATAASSVGVEPAQLVPGQVTDTVLPAPSPQPPPHR